jgi:hypothetical protein
VSSENTSNENTSNETDPRAARAARARANGAKSRGPVTPEGKARVSCNAIRHGVFARQIVLPEESRQDYDAVLNAYIEQFQPQTTVEADLVAAMAVARWRLLRLASMETNLFTNRRESNREYLKELFEDSDAGRGLAWVFNSLSQGPALSLLVRYEGSLNRAYDRAFKNLQALRPASKTPTTEQTQNLDPSSPLH